MSTHFEKNVSLKGHCSWMVGGDAQYFVEPTSIEQLQSALLDAAKELLPITVLGGGSNILISDKGVKGLVISLGGLNQCQAEVVKGRAGREELHIDAQAGVPKSEILKIFLRERLSPALFLAGLPGQVGGGVVMNAGVSEMLVPREFCEITDKITVLKFSGELVEIESTQLDWGYRRCQGWQPGIIVSAHLSWPMDPESDIPDRVRELNRGRLRKQPLDLPSCGSVFRNPEGTSAGRLIEEAGLKGYQLGGAEISRKHANFIVNNGEATATEIRELIRLAQSRVQEKFGIELETEVVFLGEE